MPFYIGMQQGIARLADVGTDAWAARARVKQLDAELRTNTPVDPERNIDAWTLALAARLAVLARAHGAEELFELPVRKPRSFEERAPRLGEVGTAVPHELAEASHAARELWKQCERRWPAEDPTHAPEETNDAAHDAAE